MRNLKLPHLIKNKFIGLSVCILTACQSNIVYHSYRPVPIAGWSKSDTLIYTLPPHISAGDYALEIDIRYQEVYPYRNLWLTISTNMQDTLVYQTDSVELFLADENGNREGNGPGGLHQYKLHYKPSLHIQQEGKARTFRINQIMKDNPLKGINDIGIKLTDNR